VLAAGAETGARTLAITNVPDSPLAAAAQETLPLHAGPERAVAATKTFTNSVAALLLLAGALASSDDLRAGAARLPGLVADVLRGEETIRARVERFRYLEECVVLGRGYCLSIAHELALKLREAAYVRAQPYAAPDFLHGPIASLDARQAVLAIAARGRSLPSVHEAMAHARARGAEVVALGNAPEALDAADVGYPVLPDADCPEWLAPVPIMVAGQIFVHALALLKGIDPDRPRGLRKVTVTR
jgi:glucosamine--fructose-6-phosphate aminotransferase (isomerizing)